MRRFGKVYVWLLSCLVLIVGAAAARSQDVAKKPLRLVQTIAMSNVKGRIDHMDLDVRGKRLFVAGLENGTLEVVDLQAGKRIHSIPGFKKPQGVLFVPELNKLFVASGDDALLRVFKGDTLDLLDSVQLEPGPNRVVYEPHTKLVYVGYGGRDAGKDYGEVGIIDAKDDKHVGDIRVSAHPSELLLDPIPDGLRDAAVRAIEAGDVPGFLFKASNDFGLLLVTYNYPELKRLGLYERA